jgi:hypothetical protein
VRDEVMDRVCAFMAPREQGNDLGELLGERNGPCTTTRGKRPGPTGGVHTTAIHRVMCTRGWIFWSAVEDGVGLRCVRGMGWVGFGPDAGLLLPFFLFSFLFEIYNFTQDSNLGFEFKCTYKNSA